MPACFDYQPGWINARFSHDTFDYIHLDIHLVGDVTITTPVGTNGEPTGEPEYTRSESGDFTVYMSSVFCPFKDFIAFLEAIALGVQKCSFNWDPEGPDGAMAWCRSVRGWGSLTIEWSSRAENLHFCTLVNTRQVLGALYGAFRSFVDSPAYDPFKYERLSLRDGIELTLVDGSIEDVIGAVARLDAVRADGAMRRILNGIQGRESKWQIADLLSMDAGEPSSSDRTLIDADWDACLTEQRTERLYELVDGLTLSSWYGANLRKLRSRIIEEALADGWQKKSTTGADPRPDRSGT